nr:hypothetical protein [Tanacetum cinerariifolium]
LSNPEGFDWLRNVEYDQGCYTDGFGIKGQDKSNWDAPHT